MQDFDVSFTEIMDMTSAANVRSRRISTLYVEEFHLFNTIKYVCPQADIAHSAKGYESEDENASRKRQRAIEERPAGKTNMYSKQVSQINRKLIEAESF